MGRHVLSNLVLQAAQNQLHTDLSLLNTLFYNNYRITIGLVWQCRSTNLSLCVIFFHKLTKYSIKIHDMLNLQCKLSRNGSCVNSVDQVDSSLLWMGQMQKWNTFSQSKTDFFPVKVMPESGKSKQQGIEEKSNKGNDFRAVCMAPRGTSPALRALLWPNN